MLKGQIVTVSLYGGKTAPRRVIAAKGNVVVICSEDEFLKAEIEGRDPVGLGFPKEDVLDTSEKEACASQPRSRLAGSVA